MNTKNLLPITFLFITSLIGKEPVYRVAFDLGSGKIKMQAALVDGSSFSVLESSEIELFLREAIDQDENCAISEEMIQKLLSSLQELQSKAALKGIPFQSIGAGTESFRLATNGSAVLKRLEEETGIRLFCLSPEEEALLGVKSLRAEKKVGIQDHFISIEFGGGSMQISYVDPEKVQFFNKNLGKVPVKNYILKTIQKKDPLLSPNPISQSEANETLAWLEQELKEAPLWTEKSSEIKVLGLGAIYPNIKRSLEKSHFTKSDISSLLSERIGKTDAELLAMLHPSHQKKTSLEFLVSDLLFLYAVMEKLQIEKMTFADLKGPGSTSGLLLDESRWK